MSAGRRDDAVAAEFDDRYTEYQTNRSFLRKLVRKLYLRSARSKLRGATLDFGCGVGELLAMLPHGSKGLEYNHATVEYCRHNGLDVDWYDGLADDWRMSLIADGPRFQSMIISHVLEHFDQPIEILRHLLLASTRIGISRVLVIVPGRAGYRIDATHRTFVDRAALSAPAIVDSTGYHLQCSNFFPGNVRAIGDHFPYHELQALFLRE